MNSAKQGLHFAPKRAEIALYDPPVSEGNFARWKIGGFGASIIIWTVEEWERLNERPADAQYYPCGVWCALRLD